LGCLKNITTNYKVKISVYITSYNQKSFLKEAIDSVLNQTYKPFEIIIVDDCSMDGSQDLIKEYANTFKNVRYIFHKKNKGVSDVRITALNNIKGDYVTYLDGDDLYLPNKLQVESNIILSEKCDLAFSNNMYVNEEDTNKINWIWASNPIDLGANLFVKTISRDFPRNNLFRMELINYKLLKEIGFHDTNLKIYEDYDLRIRLAKSLKFGYSLEPTTKIRISKKGLSKSPINEHIKAFKYIFKKYSNEIESLDIETKTKLNNRLSFLLNEMENINGMGKINFLSNLKNRAMKKLSNVINKF